MSTTNTATATAAETTTTATATAAVVAADTAAETVAETPPLSSSLTVLGGAVIGGCTIAFGTLASRPRLWICTTTAAATAEEKEQEEGPRVIGYLTGLVTGDPELWICDDNAWEWINSTNVSVQLKAAAARVWDHCVRTCNG